MDTYVEGLLDSADPSVAYRAHRLLADEPETTEVQRRRRWQVAETPNVRRLLAHRRPDGTIRPGNESTPIGSSRVPTGPWPRSRNSGIRPVIRTWRPW